MSQRKHPAPWSKQSLCVITPQYSAPGRAYDFRGKVACKCWQPHGMVNLNATWQSNYYQTTHQMARYISIWNPLFGRLDPPIIAKTCKKDAQSLCIYAITWYIRVAVRKTDAYSYNTSASWSSPKWLASRIGPPNFRCPGSAPVKVRDLKLSGNVPSLVLGKVKKKIAW